MTITVVTNTFRLAEPVDWPEAEEVLQEVARAAGRQIGRLFDALYKPVWPLPPLESSGRRGIFLTAPEMG